MVSHVLLALTLHAKVSADKPGVTVSVVKYQQIEWTSQESWVPQQLSLDAMLPPV